MEACFTRGILMQECELESFGIYRIPIAIPFPQAGGPTNVYAIETERGLLLFDTGLGTTTSQTTLIEGLARHGHRVEEAELIILSHGHIDHFGNATWVRRRAGWEIPVYIHSADAGKVLESGMDWPTTLRRNRKYLTMLGMPLEVLEETAEALSPNPNFGDRLSTVNNLYPGTVFQCRHISLEVMHMPGHTPGLCCLYDHEHRLFFSADHFLERVSPNPIMDLEAEGTNSSSKPLITYLQSLDRVRALEPKLILPGHGVPFGEPNSVMYSLASFYHRRQTKLLATLERRNLTVYEAMKELFTQEIGFELILMMSETLGNLEVLESRGEVVRETIDGLVRFRLAGKTN
jgi:glyoxylase-like metal-dependent hydrolase (beta-lactamase superfamily II)